MIQEAMKSRKRILGWSPKGDGTSGADGSVCRKTALRAIGLRLPLVARSGAL